MMIDPYTQQIAIHRGAGHVLSLISTLRQAGRGSAAATLPSACRIATCFFCYFFTLIVTVMVLVAAFASAVYLAVAFTLMVYLPVLRPFLTVTLPFLLTVIFLPAFLSFLASLYVGLAPLDALVLRVNFLFFLSFFPPALKVFLLDFFRTLSSSSQRRIQSHRSGPWSRPLSLRGLRLP